MSSASQFKKSKLSVKTSFFKVICVQVRLQKRGDFRKKEYPLDIMTKDHSVDLQEGLIRIVKACPGRPA